ARDVYVRGRGETGFLLIVLDEWRISALQALGDLSAARALVEATQVRWRVAAGREPDALSRHGVAWAFALEGDLNAASRLARENLAEAAGFSGLTPFQVERTRLSSARIISVAGDPALARKIIDSVIAGVEPAGRRDALDAWYLYVAEGALEADDPVSAREPLRKAIESIATITDRTAQWQAELARVRGRLALAEGRLEDAESDLAPLPALIAGAPAFRVAIAWLDVAALRHAQHRREEVRDLLRINLPVLRESVLPTQPDRVRAERLAQSIGFDTNPSSP
ncbi:MAG: hypothetical protein ABI650_07430, partial [Dokdonella sp.]